MMRPTMDQVIEFVRGGEVDRKVADMLRVDPDSDSKLREARFICEMIGATKAPDLDEDDDMTVGRGEESLDALRATDLDEAPMLQASLRLVEPPSGEAQIPQIRDMTGGYSETAEELGTLTVEEKEDHTFISFESTQELKDEPDEPEQAASAAGLTFYQLDVAEFASPRGRPDAIRIEGISDTISLTDRLLPGKPLMLRFSGQGADSTEVLYMPDNGPFYRTTTNRKGVATLPPDLRTGVIRISGHQFQTLLIRRK